MADEKWLNVVQGPRFKAMAQRDFQRAYNQRIRDLFTCHECQREKTLPVVNLTKQEWLTVAKMVLAVQDGRMEVDFVPGDDNIRRAFEILSSPYCSYDCRI